MGEPDYFCAKCCAKLTSLHDGEEECPKCDAKIQCSRDYLTRAEVIARMRAENQEWEAAKRDGLIR